MQNRQQIREQLGLLEEKLEELGALATAHERGALVPAGDPKFGSEVLLHEALDSLSDLTRLVHEQQLLKSVSAQDFLVRVAGLLTKEAAEQGVELAVSYFGDGKISMEMAELVMGAVVTSFRAALKSQQGLARPARVKNHLFPTGSVYLEMVATPGEIRFRLLDDGLGAASAPKDRRFHKLREHVAKCGGWFGTRGFQPCGELIEFKIPLSHNRVESVPVRQGGFEALLPSTCVLEVLPRAADRPVPAEVFGLDETEGLTEGDPDSPVLLRVGVADLQFWIGCESVGDAVRVRRVPADDFVEEGAWLRAFGLFQDGGTGRALPLIDGAALVQFHRIIGGES